MLLSCWRWWWCKQTLGLLVNLHLDLSIIIADQNKLFHGQVGIVIGQITTTRYLSDLANF